MLIESWKYNSVFLLYFIVLALGNHFFKIIFCHSGGIVALGKFDALHVGHRELAIQASMVGSPFLLSFVGIAEVLGWEPR